MKNFWCKLVLIFILSYSFGSCKGQESYFLTQGEVFRTSFHIKYKYTRELGTEIRARLDSFDLSLNPFNKQSIIYKVNNNIDVEVDDWFISVFNKAQEVARQSNGSYDITCAPLINLWGFGYDKMDKVSPQVIDSLKQFIGYEKVRLEGRKVIKKDPRLQINASSIAKGYSCDVIAELLDFYGIQDYMIEIGGEIRAKGKNATNVCWKIEIPKPIDNPDGRVTERQTVVPLCNRSIATSGNYRNFYIKDGKKYVHTIDPVTGYPSRQNLLSATVFASDCMTADAYATAFMVLGLEKACVLADSIPGLDYYFIYADDNGQFQVRRSSKAEAINY